MGTKYQGTEAEIRALNAYIKLQRAAASLDGRTSEHLARHGLTASQFGVLETLYHLGTLSQRDLAEKLLTSTGNMTTVLKNLERDGLIDRQRNPDDNRYMRVCLTSKGEALIRAILPEHVQGIVDEMSILTDAEMETLGRLCRKLGLKSEAG